MAAKAGEKTSKKRPLRYFYLNGNLHKKLHIDRGQDKIITWCYPLKKRVTYTYTDVKRNMETAFTTQEVCKMLRRSRVTIEMAIVNGMFEPPQHTYALNENMKKFKYMWNEEAIMRAHAYLATVHRGRPRRDGLVVSSNLPTPRELRAMIRHTEVVYVKVGDDFVPVWDAPDFS